MKVSGKISLEEMRSSHGESILHQEEGLASKDQAKMDFEFFKLEYETSILFYFTLGLLIITR